MSELFLVSILTFFACIGMVHAAKKWLLKSFDEEKSVDSLPSIVYYVKNRQDDIETVIRTYLWKFSIEKHLNQFIRFIVVDLGSDDDTYSILKKLEREYESLLVFDKQTYINEIERES